MLVVFLSLTIVSCQRTAVGEATRIPYAENVSDVRYREQLTVSEAREFQNKELGLKDGRIQYAEKKMRSRGKERKEQGEEELPISLPFPVAVFDIAHVDLAAALGKGTWEKVSVPGFGSYWSVSSFTDQKVYSDSNKGVVKLLAVAYGSLYSWDLYQPVWKQMGVGQFTYPDYFFDAQIDPTNKDHFIVAVRDVEKGKLVIKIYSTYDSGKTWVSSLSLSNVDGYDVVSLYFMDGKHVILEHATEGIFTSSDSGKTWKKSKKGSVGRQGRLFPGFNSQGDVLLYFPDEKKIFQSTNFGETWSAVFDTVPFSKTGEISYAVSNARTKYIIASQKEAVSKMVYRQEEGKGWTSSLVPFPSNGPIQSFVVDPKNDNHLVIFQYMFGPAESWDGGQTWARHYADGSGLKVDVAKELCPPDVEGCQSLAYDLRSTFVDEFFHLYHATDQGLFMIIPSSAKGSKDMFQNNIAKSLSFTESFDVKTDICGNLYYGVWHRSPVIQTKDGVYFVKSPEKAGFILSDPTQCLQSPALIYGYYGGTGVYSYVEDLATHILPAAISYKNQIQGAILYFKDHIYYIDAKSDELRRSDTYYSSPSETLLDDIVYIFKSKGGSLLYAVDSLGALWQTNDGMLWNEFIFPIPTVIKDDFKLRSGAAVASNFILAFSDRFFASVDSGKTIQSWVNSGKIIQVQSDASCQTRLFGVSESVDKQGVTIRTIKISYDFGQTWQEFGEGIAGVHELYLGDSDSKSVYVSTIGKGVWKRSTEGLVCKKWSEIEQKFSTIKESCGNGFDDDGNGLADCADSACANSVTSNYQEEIMCLDKISQVCSPNDQGKILNIGDNFDVLCSPDLFSSSWVECNADGSVPEKSGLKGAPFAGVGVSKSDSHYLCAPFKSSLGKSQKGYHGFESWYVCGAEKKGDGGVVSEVGDVVGNFVCTTDGWANSLLLQQFCDATEKPNTKVGSKKDDSICAQRADSVGVIIKDKLVWDETCVGVYRGIPVVELVSGSGKQLLFGALKSDGSLMSSIGWEGKVCGVYVNSVKKKGWGSSDSFAYPLTFDEAKNCIDNIDSEGKKYFQKLYLDGCS